MLMIQAYNIDRVVTPKNYVELKDDQLLVHGEFYTIQGEGPFMGYPAYFVRLAGCNYGDKNKYCRMCDTTFDFDKGTIVSAASILERALSTLARVLVVTGGEPFLQSRGLAKLSRLASQEAFQTQVETNGVYFKDFDMLSGLTTMVISPKPSYVSGYSTTLIQNLILAVRQGQDNCFKFLIGTEPPYDVIPELRTLDTILLRKRVFLSPVTVYKRSPAGEIANAWDSTLVDHEKTAANHALAAKLCTEYGFRLSLQMHNFCQLA